MSSSTTVTIEARMARPVASPTPCGPPEALKPYQQWMSATAKAKTTIVTTDSTMSRPWMNAEK